MMRAALFPTFALVVLAACATTPKPDVQPAPEPLPAQTTPPGSSASTGTTAAFDPVGTYDFTANMQGQAIRGTMVLTRGPDGRLGGEVNSDQGLVIFTSITLEGRKMTAAGAVQNGPAVSFEVQFTGDEFAGNFWVQETTGTISGVRRR